MDVLSECKISSAIVYFSVPESSFQPQQTTLAVRLSFLTTTTMNPVHDPARKTSINSLLNPQVAPFPPTNSAGALALPHPQSHVQHHHASPQMPPLAYASSQQIGAPFHLRAADWDSAASRRRPPSEGSAPLQHNHYHDSPPHMPPSMAYADHDARIPRQRADDHARYPSQGPIWGHPQQDPAGMPYAPKAPHNSAERERELP